MLHCATTTEANDGERQSMAVQCALRVIMQPTTTVRELLC